MSKRPSLLLSIAVAGCTLVLAACGSSSGKAGTTTSPGVPASVRFARTLKFSQCMRSHGVTNFPDPTSGGGIQISSSSGVDPASPAFQSAQKACASLSPFPKAGGPVSEAAKTQMLKLASCMRSHGITNFPDPTTTPPPPPGGANGPIEVLGHDGLFLVLGPGLNPQSVGFKQAASACGFRGG